jgi:hypothetical protein
VSCVSHLGDIGPDCLAVRPKRTGVAWQQLRASAAVAIEWLRVNLRQGWLGNGGRYQASRQRASKYRYAQILDERAKLNRHGGGIAGGRTRAGPPPPASAGHATDTPPSEPTRLAAAWLAAVVITRLGQPTPSQVGDAPEFS